jgi:sugar (pentulose or hexulose) kinase
MSTRGNAASYLLGIDIGTESVRVGVYDTNGKPLALSASTYKTTHPHPGWAEQDSNEWWSSLVKAVHGAMVHAKIQPERITGISCDSTTCTVVALDASNQPLRPAILWMDVRTADRSRLAPFSSGFAITSVRIFLRRQSILA